MINILPLDVKKIRTIAVIGDNATRKHAYGGNSTTIKAKYEITPLEGLQEKDWRNRIKINFSQGYAVSKDLKAIDRTYRSGCDDGRFSRRGDHFRRAEPSTRTRCEGDDKPDMDLPYGQNELIKAVIKANPNTVVVMIAGTP
jgi:beta-glucosidase